MRMVVTFPVSVLLAAIEMMTCLAVLHYGGVERRT